MHPHTDTQTNNNNKYILKEILKHSKLTFLPTSLYGDLTPSTMLMGWCLAWKVYVHHEHVLSSALFQGLLTIFPSTTSTSQPTSPNTEKVCIFCYIWPKDGLVFVPIISNLCQEKWILTMLLYSWATVWDKSRRFLGYTIVTHEIKFLASQNRLSVVIYTNHKGEWKPQWYLGRSIQFSGLNDISTYTGELLKLLFGFFILSVPLQLTKCRYICRCICIKWTKSFHI